MPDTTYQGVFFFFCSGHHGYCPVRWAVILIRFGAEIIALRATLAWFQDSMGLGRKLAKTGINSQICQFRSAIFVLSFVSPAARSVHLDESTVGGGGGQVVMDFCSFAKRPQKFVKTPHMMQ